MIDKVQKIREEVERLKGWNNNVRNSTRHMTLQEEDFNRGKHSSYLEILNFIDSLQEEPDYCCGECVKWVDGKGCSREKKNTHCITDAACEEGVRRCSKQNKPKFKVGDTIKSIDSCLGSPRTICEVCDSWYVTNQGTLDFEFEDNWELVEEPISEDLEEASYKFVMDNFGNPKEPLYKFNQRCFKAGANWQKQQDKETIELAEDHAMLAGRMQMKEELMKDAMYLTYCGSHAFSACWCMENVDTSCYKAGERLKIIVVKED